MAKTKDKKKEAEEAPPEAAAEGADGEAAPKKKGPPILIIAIVAGVLVLGGGGAGAYFLFLAPKPSPAAVAAAAAKAAADKKAAAKKDEKKEDAPKPDPKTIPTIEDGPNGVKYFKMPDVIANIQSPDGHASYLKLKLTFECDDDTADLLKDSMPRVNDILQGFMGELRPDDVSSSAGDMQLRQEILRRINLILAPHKINAVLIEQKLIT